MGWRGVSLEDDGFSAGSGIQGLSAGPITTTTTRTKQCRSDGALEVWSPTLYKLGAANVACLGSPGRQ